MYTLSIVTIGTLYRHKNSLRAIFLHEANVRKASKIADGRWIRWGLIRYDNRGLPTHGSESWALLDLTNFTENRLRD